MKSKVIIILLLLTEFTWGQSSQRCQKVFIQTYQSLDSIQLINQLVKLKNEMDLDPDYNKDQIYQLSMRATLQNGLNELIRIGGTNLSNLFFEKLKESQIEIKQKRKQKIKEEIFNDSQSLFPKFIKRLHPVSEVISNQKLNLQLIYSEKSKVMVIIDFAHGKIRTIEVDEPLSDLQFSSDNQYLFAISTQNRNSISRFDLKTFESEIINLKKEYSIQKISPSTDSAHVLVQTKKKTYLVDWNNPAKKQRIFIQLYEKLMQFIDHENIVLRWQDAVYLYNIQSHTARLLFKSISHEKIQVTQDLRFLAVFNILNKRYRIFDIHMNDFVHDEKMQHQLHFQTIPRQMSNYTYLQTEKEFSIFNNQSGIHMYTFSFEDKIQSWIFNEKTSELTFFIKDSNHKNKQLVKLINLKRSTSDEFTLHLPEVRTAFYLTDDILLTHDEHLIYFINLRTMKILYSIGKTDASARVFGQNYAHLFYELNAANKTLIIQHLFGD